MRTSRREDSWTSRPGRGPAQHAPYRPSRVRLAVLLTSFVLVGAVIASNLLLLGRLSNDDRRQDMDQIVATTAAAAAQNARSLLAPAESMARLNAGLISSGELSASDDQSLARVFHENLVVNPSYDGMYLGRPDGTFVYVRRATDAEQASMARPGAGTDGRIIYHETIITLANGGRPVVTIRWLDASYKLVAEVPEPLYEYDPRTRGWFREAATSRRAVWTAPYTLFSSGRPGVTRAEPVLANTIDDLGRPDVLGVVGVDIEMSALSAFIATQRVSANGLTAVVTEDGAVIAYPGIEDLADDAVGLAHVTEIGDERLDLAFTLLAQQNEQGPVAIDGSARFRAAVAPVDANLGWYVFAIAPEADFLAARMGQGSDVWRVAIITAVLLVILVAALVLWILRAVRRLHRDVSTDELTALASRSEVLHQLDELLADPSARVAVVLADLDHFKVINDEYGHAIGDEVLRIAAQRLRAAARPDDLVGRLGGDEFIIVQTGQSTSADTLAAAQRIHEAVAGSVAINDLRIGLSASVGVADTSASRSRGQLLRAADVALYSVKKSGRAGAKFYDPELGRALLADEVSDTQMQRALDQLHFELRFQPEVNLISGRICGAEALLRWTKPNGETVDAEHFISQLEVSGGLAALLPTVLESATTVGRELRSSSVDLPRVRINMARSQILSDGFLEQLRNMAPGDRMMLQIELRESDLVEPTSELIDRLHAVRALGIGLAIDDFGTGLHSLSTLTEIPITELRLHRGFVDQLAARNSQDSSAALIASIARTMGVEISAVGIETDEQRRLLVELGCERGQGYLFGPAVPVDELIQRTANGILEGGARPLPQA